MSENSTLMDFFLISEQFQSSFGAVLEQVTSDFRVNENSKLWSSFRAIYEQFRSSFEPILELIYHKKSQNSTLVDFIKFRAVSEQFTSNFRVSDHSKLWSSFRAVSEQFQSDFGTIPEQFTEHLPGYLIKLQSI